MVITPSILNNLLGPTDGDIAAGISEVATNRYAAKHHELFPTLYSGEGEAPMLDLKFDYEIKNPIKFDFASPADALDFKRSVVADPLFRIEREFMREEVNAPTVEVSIANTVIHFEALGTGTHLASVVANVSAKVGITVVDGTPGYIKLFVVNLAVDIDSNEIASRSLASGCDLEALIEHVLNFILLERLRRFLQEFPMPQPHFVVEGIEIKLTDAVVQDEALIAVATASKATVSQAAFDALTSTIESSEVLGDSILGQRFVPQIRREGKEVIGSVDLTKTDLMTPNYMSQVKSQEFDLDSVIPSGDVFVSFSQNCFQLLASAQLNVSKEVENRKEGGLWYYYFKHFYKVFSPSVSIISSGISVRAEFQAGAEGGAGLKGCSSWLRAKLGATGRAEPYFHANCFLHTDNGSREMWLLPRAFPFLFLCRAYMSPWIPGLDFVLSIIVNVMVNFFTAVLIPIVSIFLKFKLVTLPQTLPGTPVPISPSFNSVGNWDSQLYISFNTNL